MQAVHLYLRSFQTASSSQTKHISEQRYSHLSNACLPFLQCCNLLDEPLLALQVVLLLLGLMPATLAASMRQRCHALMDGWVWGLSCAAQSLHAVRPPSSCWVGGARGQAQACAAPAACPSRRWGSTAQACRPDLCRRCSAWTTVEPRPGACTPTGWSGVACTSRSGTCRRLPTS